MTIDTIGAVIDRMFAGLASGYLGAMRACFTPDARIWHSFDGIAHDVDATIRNWSGLVDASEERLVTDVRRQPTGTGFVQQHLFVLRPNGGVRQAWPVCIVVRIAGDRIARLDEYIDRAGSFVLAGTPLATPGF